jgi:hypothetical protein
MNSDRAEKKGQVALVAMYRAWVREGAFPLTIAEVSGRAGLQNEQFEPGVFDLMVSKGWLRNLPSGYELTAAGLEAARGLV